MAKKKTRNPHGMGSIRQRKDGLWEGRYTVGVNPKTGKQNQKSVYGKTQKIVKDKLLKINLELAQGTYEEPSNMTVAEWLDIYFDEYTKHLKYNTIYTYKNNAYRYIIPHLGDIKLAKLTTTNIQRMFNTLSKENKLSASSIKAIYRFLNSVLNIAVKIDLIKKNPAKNCILLKAKPYKIEPMSIETINKILEGANESKYKMIFYTALFTGMRLGEILGLTWDNVDFEKGTIYVTQQLLITYPGKKISLISPKNDTSRLISPAPTFMHMLLEHKKQQDKLKQSAGTLWKPEIANLVFTRADGSCILRYYVYTELKKILKEFSIEQNYTFHDLRHAYTTNSIYAGDNIKTIQENLGHASAAFTLNVYAQVTEEMRKQSEKDRVH